MIGLDPAQPYDDETARKVAWFDALFAAVGEGDWRKIWQLIGELRLIWREAGRHNAPVEAVLMQIDPAEADGLEPSCAFPFSFAIDVLPPPRRQRLRHRKTRGTGVIYLPGNLR